MNVGVDIGYSAVKAVTVNRQVTFPSISGTPERAQFSLNGHGDDILLALAGGKTRLIGQSAVEQSRFVNRREDRAWIESEEFYWLMLAAFTELTPATGPELVTATGLPLAFYADRETLRDRFLGEHLVTRDGRRTQRFRVVECRVLPQPFGALLAEALDDQGRIADSGLAAGAVGVIDMGGKTTNLLSVSRLAEVARETASVNVGAWDVMRAVRTYLAQQCPDLDLRDHQIVRAVIDRRARYYGEVVDLSPVVEATLQPMAEQVIAQATQLWNAGAGLDAILIAGGGALLLGPFIQSYFRHARVVTNPVFANAIGFWKFSQRLK